MPPVPPLARIRGSLQRGSTRSGFWIPTGELAPEELRRTSLLGASTMLRVIAGVYYELRRQELDDEDIAGFCASLNPHMAAPVDEDSIWVTSIPGEVFTPGASAPRSRRQDLRQLTDTITGWAMETLDWLALETAAATA